VHLVKVYLLFSQAPPTFHSASLDPTREWNNREELGGDEGTAPIESPSKDLLRAARRVGLGCVEEIDSQLEGTLDDGVGFANRIILAVAPLPGAELPSTQSDL